jgi:hypothetical protein
VLIVTDFRMSMTALDVVSTSTHGMREIGRPLLPAMHLVARPGTSPTITLPVPSGHRPDVDALWTFLAEAADFFGTPMPDREAVSAALHPFVARAAAVPMVALDVTVVELDGSGHCVVTGTEVRPVRTDPVRIDVCDVESPLTRADDPSWRRMAARTTSRGAEDQLRRWLNGRGYADGVSAGAVLGVPFLGALIFQSGDDLCGLDNPEPTSILNQLQQCGAIADVRRTQQCPGDAEHAWWISPRFEIHPVGAVGATQFSVDHGAVPTFARVR